MDNNKFTPGKIVYLKSNPNEKGVITSLIVASPENRVRVFINNLEQEFYLSQVVIEDKIEIEKNEISNYRDFCTYLTFQILQSPSLSYLYSFNSARVDYIPYQYRPVLKIINSDRPRILIADGVGVGKTIEAGLIFKELQARQEVNSVLIICPRPLIAESKWETEMKRFDENFIPLDGGGLKNCIRETDLDGVWPTRQNKIIVPYTLFDDELLIGDEKKGRVGLLTLDPPPRFDLVIVDEAHYVKNPETCRYKAVKYFCDNAGAVVFLTATPIQLGSPDLFTLLNILRPDLISDEKIFEMLSLPNMHINKAIAIARTKENEWLEGVKSEIKQALSTEWGVRVLKTKASFVEVSSILEKNNGDEDEVRLKIIHCLEDLYTFSNIINRTRRRDIGEFTTRKAQTVSIEFSPIQREIYESIISLRKELLQIEHSSRSINFLLGMLKRQTASCLFGLAPFIKDIFNGKINELEEDGWNSLDLQAYRDKVLKLSNMVNRIGDNDPKFEAFEKIIKEKQVMEKNKVITFSTFRHTLNYLHKKLSENGYRVGLIHGDVPDEERIILRNRFKEDKTVSNAIDVLLFSEVGCEGLDYQFCDCIVNYDVPWNPMKVEQRIGRIDRKGQTSEAITIYNFITPGTVDADIHERCHLRIGVFEKAIGMSEAILGEIIDKINDVAEDHCLSDEERRQKLQQIIDNKINLSSEEEKMEENQNSFLGIKVPLIKIQKEVEDATSHWLSQESLCDFLERYLKDISNRTGKIINSNGAERHFKISKDVRDLLLRDFQKLARVNSPMFRSWEQWLKGDSPDYVFTLDSGYAMQSPGIPLVNPIHPLVKQAGHVFPIQNYPRVKLSVFCEEVDKGIYPFAIYRWNYLGAKNDMKLIPISSSPQLTERLLKLIESARDLPKEENKELTDYKYDELEKVHYEKWLIEKEKNKKMTEEIVRAQLESLRTSHEARLKQLQDRLAKNQNAKIGKMIQAQIRNMEGDYNSRSKELKSGQERADIHSAIVALGFIEVIKD